MMEKLLQLAKQAGCSAEVFCTKTREVSLSRREGRVVDTSASIQVGYAIRVIRDGRLGAAFTKNLKDRQALLDSALTSLENGPQVEFDFSSARPKPDTEAYRQEVEGMGHNDAQDLCLRIEGMVQGIDLKSVDTIAGSGMGEITIITSSGAELIHKGTQVMGMIQARYPGTETALSTHFIGEGDAPLDRQETDRLVRLYKSSLPEVSVGEGKMKVMFAPGAMNGLFWRLGAASSGRAFLAGASPLLHKQGKRVISELITYVSDPALDPPVMRRDFDDEGVPTHRLALFENGVFTGPYANLDYGVKLGIGSTGSGFRSAMWGGEPISLPPEPTFRNGVFATGQSSFEEMMAMMDRGVIVFDVLGAHSGNILNGDFSMGFSPGFLVEGGEIKGRVRDGMMAGNVYDVLSRVLAVQNAPFHVAGMRKNPCILLDGVSVSGK